MSDDLLTSALGGDQLPDELNKTIESKGGYYEFPLGDYTCLVGTLRPTYRDANDKACKPDKPGAHVAGAVCPHIVVNHAELGKMLESDGSLVGDYPYGAYVYNQFLPLAEKDQWVSERFFGDFTLDGYPEKAVVQDKKIFMPNIRFFRGAVVTFTLTRKGDKGRPYAENVLLKDHTINVEVLKKRNAIIDAIESKLKDKLEKEQAERNKNDGTDDTPNEELPDTDSILGDIGGLSN